MPRNDETRRILLGNIAVDLGFVDERQVRDCLRDQQQSINPQPIGQALVRSGLITKRQLARILKVQTMRVLEFSQALRTQRKQVRDELNLAREMQRLLVPKEIWVPEGIEIAHYYRPAGEVGGDFYDSGRIDEQTFWVAIGDVAGKGIPAAMVTSMVFTLLRMTSQKSNSPAEILNQLNVMLHQQLRKGTFVTMHYLLIDARKRIAHLATAGHNPILVLPRNGRVLEIAGEGPALGILKPDSFYASARELRIDLAAFRRMLLFTDGLLLVLGGTSEREGKEQLMKILQDTRRKPTPEVVQHLVDEIARRSRSREPVDDVAIIALGLP